MQQINILGTELDIPDCYRADMVEGLLLKITECNTSNDKHIVLACALGLNVEKAFLEEIKALVSKYPEQVNSSHFNDLVKPARNRIRTEIENQFGKGIQNIIMTLL